MSSDTTDARQLEPLPENWTTLLAVAAHPDDLEYGAAAAIARWTAAGKTVVYCLVTSGEAGIDGMPPEEAGPLREQEERASAAVVGVHTVEFLGFPDGVVENTLALRKAIAAAIRRHRPDVVMTGNFERRWPDGAGLNQADHIHTGMSCLDAIPAAANRWIFRELLDEGLEPWGGVRALLVTASPDATHAVDTTDTFELAVESLSEHRAYLSGLGDPAPDPRGILSRFATNSGQRFGTRYAVDFEVYRFGEL